MSRGMAKGLLLFLLMSVCPAYAESPTQVPPVPPPTTSPSSKAPLKTGEAVLPITTPTPSTGQSKDTTIDLRRIPIIQNFLQNGAEIYYIGDYPPLHGFLMYKDGRVQVVYLLPNLKAVIFGGIYATDGTNISSQQITEASQQNTQLKGLMTAAVEQQKELERGGIYANASDAMLESKKNILPGGSASLAPGERILNDFITAAGIVVGKEGQPLISMLVDPQCPHCKETWSELKDHVASGAVRVKIVPIGAEGSESERQAAKFLRVKDPLNAWNKLVGGDKSVVEGTPGAAEIAAIRANMQVALNWKIQTTPYIVYRASDSKVKVVQGKPDKIGNILSDLKP